MKVNEVFYGIQGEGVHQGLPSVFVRLQGCNLALPRCSYCDTSYAWDSNNGRDVQVEDIVKEVSRLSPYYQSWVCITGGEPLFQFDELHELVRSLRNGGYRIEVETNGSIPMPRWWTFVDSWVADIKCPSSGVCGVSNEEWFKTRPFDQIKFVVGDQKDLEFARGMIEKHKVDNPVVLVSPVIKLLQVRYDSFADRHVCENWDVKWMEEVIEFCKEERVRFSLQWHKMVYGNRRGV